MHFARPPPFRSTLLKSLRISDSDLQQRLTKGYLKGAHRDMIIGLYLPSPIGLPSRVYSLGLMLMDCVMAPPSKNRRGDYNSYYPFRYCRWDMEYVRKFTGSGPRTFLFWRLGFRVRV